MSKQLVLMRDLICRYHPEFVKSRTLRRYGLGNSGIFNVERLVEECLSHVGGYRFTDGDHSDFDDVTRYVGGSDSKTASIGLTPRRPNSPNYEGKITGVVTACGGFKAGALRCTVYNPHQDRLDYFFLPREDWLEMVTYNTVSNIGHIRYNYNLDTDQIPRLADWQCDSFEQLAQMKNC